MIARTEDDVGQNVEVQIDGGSDEVEPIKHAIDPGQPTATQVEDHRKTHLPFRSWCKWCVLGRGRGLQHRKSGTSSVPVIGMDYFFLTKGGAHTRKELSFAVTEAGEAGLEASRAPARPARCQP